LFVTHQTFFEIPDLENWLDQFFKFNSYLVVNSKADSNMYFSPLQLPPLEKISLLHKYKDKILIYHTGKLEKEINNLFSELNIIKSNESEYFIRTPDFYYNQQIKNLELKKLNKFLLTTIVKRRRPHRQILVDSLTELNLLDYQIGKIHYTGDVDIVNWAGDTTAQHNWASGIISWDLYDPASFEIVPETLDCCVSYITEKTVKPIIAKIPFLILSNKEFYSFLKSIGFKTFDRLIDESFAYCETTESRAKNLAKTAKYIIDNDAIKFCEAANDICEHNFEHFLYMSAKEKYTEYISLLNFQKHFDNFNR
jgi:hypothetical protein